MNDKRKYIKQKGLERPTCINCNVRKCVTKGCRPDGTQMYRKVCYKCHNKRHKHRRIMQKVLSELRCSKCSFIAEHSCQLDIDHIDQNHRNNEPSNLQVLCANCHRLKTQTERSIISNNSSPYSTFSPNQPPLTGGARVTNTSSSNS